MIKNFGILDGGSQGTEIHLMLADEFADWLARAKSAQQTWVTRYGMALQLPIICPMVSGGSQPPTAKYPLV